MQKYTREQLMNMSTKELDEVGHKLRLVNAALYHQKGNDTFTKWDAIKIGKFVGICGTIILTTNRLSRALERAFGSKRSSRK